MGEIAEALRRARESADVARTPSSRPAAGVLHAPEPQAAPSHSGPARDAAQLEIERLEPTDPAVLVDDGPQAEACRHLAVRLRKQMLERGAQTAAVVSAVRDEGKTTVLCNLALSLATLTRDRRVAILDLDLRRPSLSRVLGVRPKLGLREALGGEASLTEIRVGVATPPVDLYLTPTAHRSAHELLLGERFNAVMTELRARYEFVLIDTPPVLVVPDVSLMLPQIDVCVPVARCGRSSARGYRQLIDALPRAKIVGAVLNEGRIASYAAYAYEA